MSEKYLKNILKAGEEATKMSEKYASLVSKKLAYENGKKKTDSWYLTIGWKALNTVLSEVAGGNSSCVLLNNIIELPDYIDETELQRILTKDAAVRTKITCDGISICPVEA